MTQATATPPQFVRTSAAAPIPITVGEAFTLGMAALKDRYGLLLGAGVIYLLITLGAGSVVGPLAKVFLAPIYIGIGWVGVRAARGDNAQLADLFTPFREYWPLVAINSLVFLLLLSCLVPGGLGVLAAIGIPALDGHLVLAWIVSTPLVIVSLVAALFVAGRLNMAGYIYMESPPATRTIYGSLESAWRLTSQSRWTLAGIIILLLLIAAASSLLLGIGVVFIGIPIAVAVHGAAYALLTEGLRGPTGLCAACGYDLAGLNTDTCPECGATNPAATIA